MNYIQFTNRLGQSHKMWSEKEGNYFICFKQDDVYHIKNEEDELYDENKYKPYKMWDGRKYSSKEEADGAIMRFVEAGIRAKVFTSKEIVE